MTSRLFVVFGAFYAALAAPCAGLPIQPPPNLVSDTAEAAKTLKEMEAKRAQCNKLADLKVAIEEEVGIGGAVALNWVQAEGGLLLDYDRTLDARRLRNPDGVQLSRAPSNELSRYLNRVGKNLAAQSSRPMLDWTFGVLGSEEVNAFSAPGGYVLVTKGLLRRVENEAQLAGVLAHEIAHITERHALKAYGAIKANQCRAAVAGELVAESSLGRSLRSAADQMLSGSTFGFLDLSDARNVLALEKFTDELLDQLTTAGFAHHDELAADRVGLELVINAGYNPHEYIRFLGKLPKAKAVFPNHPEGAERQKQLERWLQGSRPAAHAFGNSDWPYDGYPKVALGPEIDAARR